MARNEILIRSSGGGNRGNTSAVKSVTRVSEKTSNMNNNEGKLKTIAKGMRTVRTGDLGSLGLFGGGSMGAIGLIVQESVKLVNKGIDLSIEINQARTGESVRAGNMRRIKGYMLRPSSFIWEATYGEHLRELQIGRQNIKNEYYRNLTGNLTYGKQYGDK